MVISLLKHLAQLVLWMAVQGLILNDVSVYGYATPMPYLLFLLGFPFGTGRNQLMLWAFLTGVLADMLTSTPGVSAAACVLMAFFEPAAMKRCAQKEIQDGAVPSQKTMGSWGFVSYLAVLAIIHQAVYYGLMAFSFTHAGDMAINMAGGTLLTVVIMAAVASLSGRK